MADGPRALPELLAPAQAAGVPVGTAQVHRPTLDDVFLTLTGRSLREAATTEKERSMTATLTASDRRRRARRTWPATSAS